MTVRESLARRDPAAPLVAPIAQRHAARLEQLPWVRLLSDPEAIARALRTAHGLYRLDVLVGGSPALISWACRTAAAPGLAPAVAAADRTGLLELLDPQAIAEQPLLAILIDGLQRTRATTGGAGIGIVLPSASELAEQLGRQDAMDWCHQVLVCVIGRIGTAEPELIVQVGAGDDTARLENMCRFFGATIVHAGHEPRTGVVALAPDSFAEVSLTPASGWLYTSSDELSEQLDPAAVRETVARLRAGAPIAGAALA